MKEHLFSPTFKPALSNGLLYLTLLLGALACQSMAFADSAIRHYNIPAGPMATAVNQLAETGGIQAIYDTQVTQGRVSKGLQGSYSTEAALQKLLSGTGLAYTLSDGTVNIRSERNPIVPVANPTQIEPSSDATLPKVTVEADYSANDPVKTDDPRNKDYTTSYKSLTTKTDTPLFDSPFSLQVVPREVINDQRSATLKDALENVSGVRSNSNEQEGYSYMVRGFRVLNLYRNSLLASIAVPTTFETANLESVQVLKGPSSILFGRVDPGGTINMVTKRPLDTPYHSLTQEFGSYGHFRTVWDSTAPLTADGSLAYRLTGSYESSDTFRVFQNIDRFFISPSLLWKISDATEIKFDIQYLDNNSQSDTGFPALGNHPANIPIGRSFQEPNDPMDESHHVLGSYELTHQFNDDWEFHNRFQAIQTNLVKLNVAPVGLESNGILHRAVQYQQLDGEAYATNFDFTGKFDLLGSQHNVLVGFDLFRDSSDYAYTQLGTAELDESLVGFNGNLYDEAIDIDIFNPVYGRVDPIKYSQVINTNDSAFFSRSGTEQYGVYFQDHITLFDKLHILGGGRHDWATVTSAFPDSFKGQADKDEVSEQQFSPRVGILYQPWTWLSLYGSWSNSFGLNNGKTASGDPLPPETAEQWEAGLKTELFDQRLTATLAFYHLTKNNILTADPSTPEDPNDVIAIGQARSQGVELDIVGQITDNIGIIGNYAYTDAEVTRDNSGLQGNKLATVPENSGRLFLTYDFKNHSYLNGWRFGLGVTAVGARAGNNQNNFNLPGYARLDTFAAYSFKLGESKITTQINIQNLTDKRYFSGTDVFFNSDPRQGIYVGSPITATGTVRVEF